MGEKSAKERQFKRPFVNWNNLYGTIGLNGLNVVQLPWKELELELNNILDLEDKTLSTLKMKVRNVPFTVNLGNGANGLHAQKHVVMEFKHEFVEYIPRRHLEARNAEMKN